MPKRLEVDIREVYEDLKAVADTIAERIRAIAIGVIALSWLMLTGGSDRPQLSRPIPGKTLLTVLVLASVGLVFDYLQYLAGYLNSRRVQLDAEASAKTTTSYDYSAPLYRLRSYFFWAKQVVVLVAVVWLLIALSRSLLP